MAEVRLQEGESLENALRRFKRKVQTEDIIKDVKRHSYYLKPGERRRVKQALAQKRARKKIRKEHDYFPTFRAASPKTAAFTTTCYCKQNTRSQCQSNILPPNATDARSRRSVQTTPHGPWRL